MSITIGGQPKRLGLALSGGGFRAAGFHLGVMRKLKALAWPTWGSVGGAVR